MHPLILFIIKTTMQTYYYMHSKDRKIKTQGYEVSWKTKLENSNW